MSVSLGSELSDGLSLPSTLEPATDAVYVRTLLNSASEAAQNRESLYIRHFAPAGYGSLAWVVSFFDALVFSGKMVAESITQIALLDFDLALDVIESRGVDLFHSLKQIVLLPFCIFASIFFPEEIFGGMHFSCPAQEPSTISGRNPDALDHREASESPRRCVIERLGNGVSQLEVEVDEGRQGTASAILAFQNSPRSSLESSQDIGRLERHVAHLQSSLLQANTTAEERGQEVAFLSLQVSRLETDLCQARGASAEATWNLESSRGQHSREIEDLRNSLLLQTTLQESATQRVNQLSQELERAEAQLQEANSRLADTTRRNESLLIMCQSLNRENGS